MHNAQIHSPHTLIITKKNYFYLLATLLITIFMLSAIVLCYMLLNHDITSFRPLLFIN